MSRIARRVVIALVCWPIAAGALTARDDRGREVALDGPAGRIVAQGPGEARVGRQEFFWDGALANGMAAPDGAYTVTVQAQYGTSLETVPITAIGRITGAERADGTLKLSMGKVQIDASAIRAVAPDR